MHWSTTYIDYECMSNFTNHHIFYLLYCVIISREWKFSSAEINAKISGQRLARDRLSARIECDIYNEPR